MAMEMKESGENYLETILVLQQKNGTVRSIDVANELGFSKPSISRAVGILKANGYITVEVGGNLNLTPKGHAKAAEVYERHRLITGFLVKVLGVRHETANIDACRIEHVISIDTFEHIKEFMKLEDENR